MDKQIIIREKQKDGSFINKYPLSTNEEVIIKDETTDNQYKLVVKEGKPFLKVIK